LAQRAAVLPLHAGGVNPLLGAADVVEEEDAFGAGEGAGHRAAVAAEDLGLVPGALIYQLLERLLRVLDGQSLGEGDAAGERLDALALAVEQEPLEVNAGPLRRPGVGEVFGEGGGMVGQPAEDAGGKLWCMGLHASLYAPALPLAHRP